MQFSRRPPLLFDPEDRVFTFLRNLGGLFRTTQRYNSENRIYLRIFSAIQTLIIWLKRVSALKLNSVASVRKRTTPTEQPPLVGEVNADRGCRVVSATEPHGR
jgi:hypothetical protein